MGLQVSKYRALASFCIGGGRDVAVGEVVELVNDANVLGWLAAGRLERVVDMPENTQPAEGGGNEAAAPASAAASTQEQAGGAAGTLDQPGPTPRNREPRRRRGG